ncbi:hypothetical protein [Amycolatopsis sp. CA-230715]|uniref:hypothetical protein n=1 Tax=Amycolatopsis sp. CA-230715 TaxID=2745196 RepID=UPI001C011364|nr:hypothetical protein [Amycolatopsis sp. CA-230715]QWF85842.1 hypothetical protein HUW46_09322 [Amycolatopsis sp. CA-230715]
MPTYAVYLTQTVSTTVIVVAGDPEAAEAAAYDCPDMPTTMRPRAFGNANVDEDGTWAVELVTDVDGNVVGPRQETNHHATADPQARINEALAIVDRMVSQLVDGPELSDALRIRAALTGEESALRPR